MSTVEMIDVTAVAPDSVEVVESYRTWNLEGGKLRSHNGVAWKPGEALHATCRGGSGHGFKLSVVRSGMSLAKARDAVGQHNQWHSRGMQFFTFSGVTPAASSFLQSPTVEPPDGYGYAIEPITHETPDPGCTCGIYSGTTLDICPNGNVAGKVKLWGTLIPGDKGYRAEYAYPSEFIVAAELADDPTLLAFGVPITVAEDDATKRVLSSYPGITFTPHPRNQPNWLRRWMFVSLGLNLGACALNLLTHWHVIS